MRSGRDDPQNATRNLAAPYLPCADLWVITTHYNPSGYTKRRANYIEFSRPILEAGINLLTVECAVGDDPFELAPSPHVIQVRGDSVIWLKERLLNLAIEHLPKNVSKVAWVDADIIFTNRAWAQQCSRLLEKVPIVQPFQSVLMLAPNPAAPPENHSPSFAFQHQLHRRLFSGGHGASGYAWAARRDLIERHGIYDAAIVGSGDLLWVHASTGRLNSPPVRVICGAPPLKRRLQLSRTLTGRLDRLQQIRLWTDWRVQRVRDQLSRTAETDPALAHYQAWAVRWYDEVCGRMAYAPGTALHLWHGAQSKRQYGRRNEPLRRFMFDPLSDLRKNEQGVWEWASPKEALHQAVADYFRSRCEDGDVG